jgi:hypothetical protein
MEGMYFYKPGEGMMWTSNRDLATALDEENKDVWLQYLAAKAVEISDGCKNGDT